MTAGKSINDSRLRISYFLTEMSVCKFSDSFTEICLLGAQKECQQEFFLLLDRKKRLGMSWRYGRNTTIFALNVQGWRQGQGLFYPLNGRELGPSTAAYLAGNL